LLEKYLKIALIYSESKGKISQDNIQTIFKDGVNKYSGLELATSINACCSKGIIDKTQKKNLHFYRTRIRNPYSHADMNETFTDMIIPVQIGKINYNDPTNFFPLEQNTEVNLRHFPLFQGIGQVILSEEISFAYFDFVDDLVRNTKNKIIH
jgi:hypothetical protein